MSEFEAKLLQKGYEKLPPFFVLREGEISDERTGGVVKLTKERLETIAETQNKRIANTGDATPVIVGHTKRHLLEKDQPEEVGLTTNFRVVKFFKTNTWGLEATPWCKPEDKIHFEKFKRRSAELWTDPDLIDPISLLGANTPRLDLGLHQFSKGDHRYIPRQPIILEMDDMEEKDPADKPAGDKPASSPANAGQSSDMADLKAKVDQLMQMMSLLQPLIDELQGGGAGGDPSGGMGGPQGAPPMGGPSAMPPGGGMGGPPGAGGPPQPMQAGAGPVGGQDMMNGPQQYGMGHPSSYPMQFGYQQPQQNTAVTQELAQLRTMVASMQLQKLEGDVDLVLERLENEIVIDRVRDRDRLIKLSKADQEAEIAHWKLTRKSKEQPLPTMGLGLEHHMAAQGGPMQMSLGTAGGGFALPGDPQAFKQATSEHDRLMEIVRNRGKLSPLEAYERVMQPGANGTVTKVV